MPTAVRARRLTWSAHAPPQGRPPSRSLPSRRHRPSPFRRAGAVPAPRPRRRRSPPTGTSSCRSSGGGTTTARPSTSEAIELFEDEYPNIDVSTQFQAWDDYWTARTTEAAGQTLPDVLQMDLAYIHQYASNNQVLDLSDQVGVNLETGDIDEAVLASGSLDGGQFGIPTSTNTLGMVLQRGPPGAGGHRPAGRRADLGRVRRLAPRGQRGRRRPATRRSTAARTTPAPSGCSSSGCSSRARRLRRRTASPAFDKADLVAWLERTQPLRDDGVFFPVERSKQVEPLTGLQVNQAATELVWDNLLAGYSAGAGTENLGLLPLPEGAEGSAAVLEAVHAAVVVRHHRVPGRRGHAHRLPRERPRGRHDLRHVEGRARRRGPAGRDGGRRRLGRRQDRRVRGGGRRAGHRGHAAPRRGLRRGRGRVQAARRGARLRQRHRRGVRRPVVPEAESNLGGA